MIKIGADEGEFKLVALVRDKDGHPKFGHADMIPKFWDLLSDKDKDYLILKYDLKRKK